MRDEECVGIDDTKLASEENIVDEAFPPQL